MCHNFFMLPIVSEEICKDVIEQMLPDISSWRKEMIHYIKEENCEVNSAIIEIAQKTGLDPKAVATGAYMTYWLLEESSNQIGEDTTLLE